MSLKAFHLVFLVASIALAIGFCIWAIREYRSGGGAQNLGMGIGAGVAAVVMIAYSRWFLRKLKHVSYL
jgi:hypothetical protein